MIVPASPLNRDGGVGGARPNFAGMTTLTEPMHRGQRHRQGEEALVGGDDRDVAAHQRPQLGDPALRLRRLHRLGRRHLHRLRGDGVDVRGVHLVVLRALPAARPVVVAVALEGGEDIGPGAVAEEVQRLLGRTEVGDRAARRHHQELVADGELGHRVGDHQDRAAVVGEAAEQLHDVAVHARVEARGGLVQEDQRRLGEELQGHRDALALAAGEGGDLLLLVDVQLELAQHLVDALLALVLGGVGGEAQLGRVLQRLLDGQLLVQDVVLRDQTDALAQLGELLVQVPVVVEDVALVGGPVAGERLEQGGLSGARGADDRDEGLLGDAEGDVLEDVLAAVDRDGQVAGGEGDVTGVDELFEPVADDAEGRVADADDVVAGRAADAAALGDRLAVDVGAVVRAEVADLHAAVGGRVELGVVARDLEVGDDQLVLERTADAHDPAERQTGGTWSGCGPRRPAERPPRHLLRACCCGSCCWACGGCGCCHACCGTCACCGGWGCCASRPAAAGPAGAAVDRRRLRLLGRGGLRVGGRGGTGQIQPRAVGRVAEVDRGAGADFHLVDPLALHIGAVGGSVVLDDPTAAAPADRGVPPRDSGVVHDEVALRITSQGVRPGRIERPGAAIQFQYEFRHSSPTCRPPKDLRTGGL